MKKMKKMLLIVVMAITASAQVWAANAVKFYINDGVNDNRAKKQIEQNVSALLTELNAAQEANRAINYSKIGISEEARQQVDMLWMNVHFFCDETEVVERGVNTQNGIQVRNIPLTLAPLSGEKIEDTYQEAVINFDNSGKIVSFFFTIGMNMYSKVMQNSNEISDVRRRMAILDYVEHFRTAYNMKDMPFL